MTHRSVQRILNHDEDDEPLEAAKPYDEALAGHRMLDPEALRSREIGDDPYAPTGTAKKSPMRLFSSSADELEWQFQQRVTDLAEAHGWEWHHQRNSIGSRKGWPDLALWCPACLRAAAGAVPAAGTEAGRRAPQTGAAGGHRIAAGGGRGCAGVEAVALAGDCAHATRVNQTGGTMFALGFVVGVAAGVVIMLVASFVVNHAEIKKAYDDAK